MKAFVINLDYRTDRLRQFTKTFEKFEIIREPAVCINEISPELKKRINEWNFKYLSDKKLKGVVGCCMSHLNVWEKISNTISWKNSFLNLFFKIFTKHSIVFKNHNNW